MIMQDKFKCPSCGEMVISDTMTQEMKCPFCNSHFDIEAIQNKAERQWDEEQDSITWQEYNGLKWEPDETEGLEIYTCKSCGGELIGSKDMTENNCPYCGSEIAASGPLCDALKPEYIIPFKKDKNAAKQTFIEFISGHKYIPKKFKSPKHIESVRGIYVPVWLFDAEVDAKVGFDGVKSLSFEDGKYHTSENLHHDVYREGKITFKNLPVDGSSKIPDDIMESIEPFDFSEAQDFHTGDLAGCFAAKYDEDEVNGGAKARAKIKRSAENQLKNSLTEYSTSVVEQSIVKTSGGKVKYALYPVWLLSAVYKGKSYTFAMNGQTGKFAGDLPVDRGALWKYFAKCAGIITALLYFASMIFLWG